MQHPRLAPLIILILQSFSFAAPTTGPTTRPNVLFFLIDDMGDRDLSCFGGTRVQTTNIDKVASQGMRFEQFYVEPVCSPSRVCLMTGQYPNRWHITSYLDTRELDKKRGQADWLSTDAPSLARFLHDAGYYTAHIGKWHMGGQRDVGDAPLITAYGYDTSLTTFEGLGPRILPKFDDVNGKPFHHTPTEMNAALGGEIRWVPRYWVTEQLVDRAISEVQTAQQLHKPFYINLWPDDVHSPCQAPPDMRGDDSPAANYCGVLKEEDIQFGRIFDYIQSQPDLRDNTIIVITSDNGPEHGLGSSGDLRGSKGMLWEGGIRNPLIVWWPGGISKDNDGKVNESTVMQEIDYSPTILALTGTPQPKDVHFDGTDMSDVWLGKSDRDRTTPVMWVRPPDRPGPHGGFPDLAIRDGKWKLLVFRDRSRPELFDIIADPNEKHNLAKEQPDRVKQMSDAVIAWDKSIPQ